MKRALINREGSVTSENLGWIAFFTLVLFGVVIVLVVQLSGVLDLQAKDVLKQSYNSYCISEYGDNYIWNEEVDKNNPNKWDEENKMIQDGQNPSCILVINK